MDPFFLRLSGAYVFSAKFLLGGDSWVSAAACAAPGLSLLPVVPKTEEQGAVGVLKPLTSQGSQEQRSSLYKTTADRLKVSFTRPAPLLVHDVLPERDAGTR